MELLIDRREHEDSGSNLVKKSKVGHRDKVVYAINGWVIIWLICSIDQDDTDIIGKSLSQARCQSA